MVGSLLNRATWTLTSALNIALKAEGLDIQYSQYVVLRALYLNDGISQNEIATMLHKDAAAIKRSVDYLETKGYVERRPLTGCKYGVHLTRKGRSTREQIIAIADGVTANALRHVSPEAFEQGMRFLQSIVDSATPDTQPSEH